MSGLFSKFLEIFEREINLEIQKYDLVEDINFDEKVTLIGTRSKNLLRDILVSSSTKSFGSALEENNETDKLIAFGRFVLSHLRIPKDIYLFNDQLFKLRTTDEIINPLRVFVSDKEYLKIYVKAMVGDQYNVPTIDIIRDIHQVDDYEFPDRCVIKPTHASQAYIKRINHEEVDRQKIKSWFSLNYYKKTREANYKTLVPKVIIEPFVFDNENVDDYKVLCFEGVPKLILVVSDRNSATKAAFYDTAWNKQDFSWHYAPTETTLPKPKNLDEMLKVSELLSANFGFIRIDFYSNGEQCLVGEITNCTGGANSRFSPPESEKIASEIIFGNKFKSQSI